MLSCCVIFGSRRCRGDSGVGKLLWPSQWLDSDTTRRDFSKTFHSLMVLSGKRSKISNPVDLSQEVAQQAGGARTVSGQQKVSSILPFAPLDLVNLLLDLERLEIIKLGLM